MNRKEKIRQRNAFLIEVSGSMDRALTDPGVKEETKKVMRERLAMISEWQDELVAAFRRISVKERAGG
jgi:hypothetical protein